MDGNKRDIQALCRKRSPEELYRNYRDASLREIVCDLVQIGTERKGLLDRINAVEEFLKFTYMEHVGKDSDPFHNVQYALTSSCGERSIPFDQACSGVSRCTECLSSFAITKSMSEHSQIASLRPDAVVAIQECEKKVLLVMAHKVRVSVQKKRVLQIQKLVMDESSQKKVLLPMDYKMKFEPIVYREKTVDFFGKRGISWHGAVAFYSDGNGDMKHLYIDQVVGNDSKQDRVSVLSLYDAALARLKRVVPNVEKIYVLSDNARCYQNNLRPVMLPFITSSHDLLLTRL